MIFFITPIFQMTKRKKYHQQRTIDLLNCKLNGASVMLKNARSNAYKKHDELENSILFLSSTTRILQLRVYYV